MAAWRKNKNKSPNSSRRCQGGLCLHFQTTMQAARVFRTAALRAPNAPVRSFRTTAPVKVPNVSTSRCENLGCILPLFMKIIENLALWFKVSLLLYLLTTFGQQAPSSSVLFFFFFSWRILSIEFFFWSQISTVFMFTVLIIALNCIV